VVTISENTFKGIILHAENGYPNEVCGVIIGKDDIITEFKKCKNLNTTRAHDRYELDPDSFNTADEWARSRNLEIMGIYHSHPDHPSRPSETDRESAWPGWYYIILSIQEGKFDNFRTWVLDETDTKFVEYNLSIRG